MKQTPNRQQSNRTRSQTEKEEDGRDQADGGLISGRGAPVRGSYYKTDNE